MTFTPAQKEELDLLGKLHQMKINTRLTALQTALELMKVPNYSAVHYPNTASMIDSNEDKGPRIVGGAVDHITLLAIAGDVEGYILGNLEKEATEAIDNAKKPNKPLIIPVRP